MMAFLTELENTTDSTAMSLFLPTGISRLEVGQLVEKVVSSPASPSAEIIETATSSKTGASLFWGTAMKCLILPPFPISEKAVLQGYTVKPLISLLRHDFKVALILVRLGAYAIGVCQGESLVSSKVGTGLVHGRHKKGGSSQQRFQRHREKQIESFLDRVCYHIQEQLEAPARALDYLVYGGAWTTILSLQKRCPFLAQFDKRTLPPLLDTPEPRRAVLEKAVGRIWSSTIIQWQEGETT